MPLALSNALRGRKTRHLLWLLMLLVLMLLPLLLVLLLLLLLLVLYASRFKYLLDPGRCVSLLVCAVLLNVLL